MQERADLGSLRAFVAVARLGAVSRAGEALSRTQPSISARIARLEEAWGTRLFRRRARGMDLTPEGARLLPLAEAAIARLEDLDRAAGLPVAGAGEVRVGAGDALGRELLPRVLARLQRTDPGVGVRVLEGPGSRLLEFLRRGEIDVALLIVPPGGVPVSDDVDTAPLLRTSVDLLCPAGRAPRRVAGLRESVRTERWVALQPDSEFRRHVEVAFARRGIPFRPAVEVGNLSLVRRFVSAGLGVAPVPAVAFADRSPGPAVLRRPLREVPPVMYSRVVRRGVPLPEATARFLDLLAKHRK